MLGNIIVIGILALVVLALGSGMVSLIRDRGQSTRTVRALTARIVLSLVLIGVIFLLYALGLLHPHGIVPPQHP